MTKPSMMMMMLLMQLAMVASADEEFEVVTSLAGNGAAECPSGYTLTSCKSEPQDSGSGVQITATSCQAGATNASSTATCWSGGVSTVKTSVSATGEGELKASCDAGKSALWCYCHSADEKCSQSAFEPSGSDCVQTLSDRNDATVSALCSPDYRVCEDNEDAMIGWGKPTCAEQKDISRRRRRNGSCDWANNKKNCRLTCGHCEAEGLLIETAEGKLNTRSVSKCAETMFLLDTSDGENTCVEACPPGYIDTPGASGGYGTCTVCKGSTSRRRAMVCNKCGPGKSPMANSNNCRNMQDMCDAEGCENCRACLNATKLEITTCVISDTTCYNPTTDACAVVKDVYSCKGKSLGCWYREMCESACVCEEWKTVFCGGVIPAGTEDDPLTPCPEAFMMLLQGASVAQKDRNASFIALHQERMTREAARPVSLDQSLSGKRQCNPP